MSDLLSIYNELQSKKWVDLTHKINAESPHFPALPALKQEDLFTLKDDFHVQKFTVVGQYGMHIDAPIHFVEGGRWLDEIDLKDLLLPLYFVVIGQNVGQIKMLCATLMKMGFNKVQGGAVKL